MVATEYETTIARLDAFRLRSEAFQERMTQYRWDDRKTLGEFKELASNFDKQRQRIIRLEEDLATTRSKVSIDPIAVLKKKVDDLVKNPDSVTNSDVLDDLLRLTEQLSPDVQYHSKLIELVELKNRVFAGIAIAHLSASAQLSLMVSNLTLQIQTQRLSIDQSPAKPTSPWLKNIYDILIIYAEMTDDDTVRIATGFAKACDKIAQWIADTHISCSEAKVLLDDVEPMFDRLESDVHSELLRYGEENRQRLSKGGDSLIQLTGDVDRAERRTK